MLYRMPRLRDAIAAEIRAEMARQGLTQHQVASRLGERQPWLSKRLTGATTLGVEDLDRIALALGVEVGQLIPARPAVAA